MEHGAHQRDAPAGASCYTSIPIAPMQAAMDIYHGCHCWWWIDVLIGAAMASCHPHLTICTYMHIEPCKPSFLLNQCDVHSAVRPHWGGSYSWWQQVPDLPHFHLHKKKMEDQLHFWSWHLHLLGWRAHPHILHMGWPCSKWAKACTAIDHIYCCKVCVLGSSDEWLGCFAHAWNGTGWMGHTNGLIRGDGSWTDAHRNEDKGFFPYWFDHPYS